MGCSSICGCADFASVGEDWAEWLAVGVPTEIPAEVEAVLADPARFSAENHPLVGVVPGQEIVDDLDDFSGCWGYYSVNSSPTFEGPVVDVFGVDVWSVDAETHTLTIYAWFSSLPELGVSQPLLLVRSGPYRVVNARRIAVETRTSAAGVVADDGTIQRHVSATLLGAWALNEPYEVLVTLDGDYMKETDGTGISVDDLIVDGIDDWSGFYTRMDCVAD